MIKKVTIYDPTASDKFSSVRGIGRYLQILKESFGESWIFTDDVGRISADSIFVNPFYNFLKFPLSLKRIAKKQIAVIHDLIPLKYPSHFPPGIKGSIYILLNKLTLKNYDLIITDSEVSKKDIVEILKIKNQKVKIIYPCLPRSFLKLKIENLNLNKNLKLKIENFCLYVGDATWNKNLVNLARAIKIANVTCVFVGKVFDLATGVETSGIPAVPPQAGGKKVRQAPSLNNPWQKELKEFYELTKDDKRFIFAGFIPDSELFKLYEQASVNLLLSRAEGFGFSYLEAANFSCPSLLSDIPVLKEISGNQALFADPDNPPDMAKKINEICFDKTLRNKIGVSAKKRSKFFSSEKFKKSLMSLLMELD